MRALTAALLLLALAGLGILAVVGCQPKAQPEPPPITNMSPPKSAEPAPAGTASTEPAGTPAPTKEGATSPAPETKATTEPTKGEAGAAEPGKGKMVTTPSGLKYEDVKVGTGPEPKAGQTVVVHYTGTLDDGTKFDSSRDRNEPFSFTLGAHEVIPGWDEGIATMKVGGRRNLIVPPELGYAAEQKGPIPPNSTLHFDVELLEIK